MEDKKEVVDKQDKKEHNYTHRDPKTGRWYDDISGKWIDKEKNGKIQNMDAR